MTWQPTPDQLVAAIDHAGRCDPMESCGVIADGAYVELVNTATEYDAFVMDRVGYIGVSKRSRRIEAIVHSHVYTPPTPSDGDRVMCEKLGLPWLIVNWPMGSFEVLEPCGYTAPLVGREWSWGGNDCWGLVRDCLPSGDRPLASGLPARLAVLAERRRPDHPLLSGGRSARHA